MRAALAGPRAPLIAWAVSRAAVLGLVLVLLPVVGPPDRIIDPAVPHALSLLGGWDTTWYLDVARHGYAHDVGQVGRVFTNLAFFPLLPGVMALALALGINPFAISLVVSELAFLAALWGFHALGVQRAGPRAAAWSTWALALLPPALYFSLAYTEAITLAAAVAATLAATRGRFALAGLAAVPAVLARPTGAIVLLPLAMFALLSPRGGRVRRLALVLVPPIVALAAFFGWMAVARGSALLPFEAQAAWGRGQVGSGIVTTGPGQLADAWTAIQRGTFTAGWTAVMRDLAILALDLWLLARLWRSDGGLRSPWVAYSAAVVLIPLSSGTVDSVARLGLLAFPLAWPLGDWLSSRRHPALWIVLALIITALLAAQLSIRSP